MRGRHVVEMCNHYRLHPGELPSWKEYIGWSLRLPEEPFASDVYPKRKGLIIRQEDGQPVADVKSWGVMTKVRGASGKMLDKAVTNVRNLSSPFWKSTLGMPAQRCLVPFTVFAEPTLDPHPVLGKKGEHWFKLPAYPVGAFAGLWRGGEYAFLTCEPCALVAPLHPKAMPVILHPEDYEGWLSGDYDAACNLAQPFPSQMMEVETVWPTGAAAP